MAFKPSALAIVALVVLCAAASSAKKIDTSNRKRGTMSASATLSTFRASQAAAATKLKAKVASSCSSVSLKECTSGKYCHCCVQGTVCTETDTGINAVSGGMCNSYSCTQSRKSAASHSFDRVMLGVLSATIVVGAVFLV